MESYSRGRRGAPAKGVGVEMHARVQIPHSPPKMNWACPSSFFCGERDLNGALRKVAGGKFLATGVIAAMPPVRLRSGAISRTLR